MKKNNLKQLLFAVCASISLVGCHGVQEQVSIDDTEITQDENEDNKTEKKQNKEERENTKEEKENNNKKENKETKKKENKKETKEELEDDAVNIDDIVDDDEEEEDTVEEDDSTSTQGRYDIVINGVKMEIPRIYNITIHDQDSIMLREEDYNFELRLLVRNESYTKSLKNIDELTENLKALDAIIVDDIKECEINGKSYAYCTFKYPDADYIYTLAYTEGAGDNRIGMNIIPYADMSSEDLLKKLDEFLHNTTETNEPNTTEEDLSKMRTFSDGKELDDIEFKVSSGKYKMNIPKDFYYTYSSEFNDEYSSSHCFESAYRTIDVSAHIYTEEYEYNIEQYLKDELQREFSNDYSNIKISKLKKKEVNENTIYYATVEYDYDDCNYRHFFAACYLPDNAAFTFKATSLDGEDLNWELLEDFMHVEKIK